MSIPDIELSICIPNHERIEWLRAAMSRWLEELQPFGDTVELVVTDDGSRQDPTSHIPKGVIYLRHDPKIGALGNFASAVRLARGKFVWLVGNDDLPIRGAVGRVLSVVRTHKEVEHIYSNYAVWPGSTPPNEHIELDPNEYQWGHADTFDRPMKKVEEALKGDANMFTNIFVSIWQRRHAISAFEASLEKKTFFTSLETCVPHAVYVARNLTQRPGYFLGKPNILSSWHTQWSSQYGCIYNLQFLPELLELYKANGVDPNLLLRHQRTLLKHARGALKWLILHPFKFQWRLFDIRSFFRRNRSDPYLWAMPLLIGYDACMAGLRRLKR